MNDELWKDLKAWIQAYILFGKIGRHDGNEILMLMDEMEANSG